MYYYIINPTAGSGAINQVQEKLRSRLTSLGISGEFAKTTGPGDAVKMTRDAIGKGYTTIVAVGGDGTINEVINGITTNAVAVGIIPLGNSNVLAGRLGISGWQQACEVLAARRLVSFNLIAAGQKFFLSTLMLGFETDHDKAVDTSKSGTRARLQQFRSSWDQARSFTPLHCRIQADDSLQLEADIFTLSVANQKFNNPQTDNRLVITLSERPKRAHLTSYLLRLLKRVEQPEESATTRFTAQRLVIQTTPTTGIMIDGKLAGRTPMAIRLTDRRIRFITEKQQANIKSQL